MRNHVTYLLTAALLFGAFLLVGCAQKDLRLVEDQQSCLQMGHTPGTAAFQMCMADLNNRRCPLVTTNLHETRHFATEECTRLPSSYSP